MPDDHAPEIIDVLSQYDLGRLVRARRGTASTSSLIETVQDGQRCKFLLRRCKRGIRREEIPFERALINRIARLGACPVARVYPTREGPTFLHRPEGEGPSSPSCGPDGSGGPTMGDPAGPSLGRVMKMPWFLRGTVLFSGQGALSPPC